MFCLALSGCKTEAERAEEAYLRGMALLEAGDEARARVEFRNALAEDISHAGAHLQMARLSLREGDEGGAFRSYERAYEKDPENLEAVTAMARIAFLQTDWDRLELYATRAKELAPEDPAVKVITLVHGYRKAVVAKDAAARKALLAEAEGMATGREDDLLLRLVRADGYTNEGRFGDALEQIDGAIATAPANPALHLLKLGILSELQDVDGIKAELHRAIATFPTEPGYKISLLRFLIGRGDLDEAEAFLREEAAPEKLALIAKEEDRLGPVVNLVQFLNLNRGREPALAELETRLAAAPEAHALRALRAGLVFEAGRRDEGIAEMEALLAREDLPAAQRQPFKVALAGMLGQTGNEVGARRLVEEVLEVTPDNPDALKIKAGWLIAEDKTAEAITALRTALAARPKDAAALTLMAQAHERAGNADLMLESLSQAVEASGNAPVESRRYAQALLREKRLDQAESTLIAALRLAQGDVGLLSNLGQVYLAKDDRPLIRKVKAELAAIDSPEARRAANELELQLLQREKGTDEALAYLGSLAGEDQDDRVKLALIRAQLVTGKTQEALDYANQLVAEKPQDYAYRFFQSLAMAAAEDYAGAEAVMAALVRERADQPQAWLQLARLRGLSGSQEAMRATLDEALAANPGAADILWAKATFLEQDGDIDGAIAIYEELYARDSSSLVVANNLASLLSTYREDAESLARAETIARRLKTAEAAPLQETYGWILFRNGKAEEALPYLEPAARALAGDPTVQVHLGLAYHAVGRIDEAKAQLERARSAAGTTPTAAVKGQIATLETALAP